jgi:hypothetical protein
MNTATASRRNDDRPPPPGAHGVVAHHAQANRLRTLVMPSVNDARRPFDAQGQWRLTPAYEVAVRLPGDLTENMVRAQGRLDVAELNADPLIAGLIADHGLLVVGGRYNLTSGAVEIIA